MPAEKSNNRAAIWIAVSTKRQAQDEKASLPAQQRDAEALCEREGLIVVEPPLVVPGHSRRYLDFFLLAADARAAGVDAFDRLDDLINQNGFDVLVVRDGDRFARTQALHAYIVERVIDSGARIYSLTDGWIDRTNYRMWIAMVGYRAASEVDALVKKRLDGMVARTQRGLPAGDPVLSHKLIRNESTGKPIKLILDPAKQPLLATLADLLFAGVAYNQIHNRLFELGFVNSVSGNRYSISTFQKLLYNPWFWGHSAFNYDRTSAHPMGKLGRWTYDETEPAPHSVVVYRNTHEPAYTGELAMRVQAEMQRRESMWGRRHPDSMYAYTGLLICGHCGRTFRGNINRANIKRGYHTDYVYYNCFTHYLHKRGLTELDCAQRGITKREAVDTFVRALLTEVAQENFTSFMPEHVSQRQSNIAALQTEIDVLERQLEAMVREQSERQNTTARALYARQIDQMAERLEGLTRNLGSQNQLARADTMRLQDQQQSAATIRKLGIEHYMNSPRELNQLLHRLLGHERIRVKDRTIYLEVGVNIAS